MPDRVFPILEWLPGYRRADLTGDLVAGITGAAILIPQSMAYATIAGLPPVVGLYASVVPLLVYAVLGRSAPLGVGPLASISILSALAVGSLAHGDSARFIALSATLAVLVGGIHILVGVLRLGFVLRLVSEPVVTGFLAAIGVLLIVTQLGVMTGVQVPTAGRVDTIVVRWIQALGHSTASLSTLALALASVALLLFARRWRRFPAPLVLVIFSTAVSGALMLSHHGIATVGPVPKGLPAPKVPPFHGADVLALLPTAFAITLISVLESVSVARRYADEHGYRISTDQEIVALGAANVSAGFFQGFVVTGAISRTSILDESGARTPLTGVVSAAVVVPVLAFAAGLFRNLPLAVLSAIVITAVLPFLDVGEARRLWRVKRSDFWTMMLAFVGSLVFGILEGVLLAAATSIVLIVTRVARSPLPELGRQSGTDAFVERHRHPDAVTFPGAVILRVNTPLYFTNAESLENRLRALVATHPEIDTVVLDASGVDHLDATADHALRRVATDYAARRVAFYLVNLDEESRQVLDASGFTDLVGPDHYFATDADAVAHLTSR